jgi:hypothetical protein
MSPGSLETARPSVTGATQGLCESDHGHSCGERFKGKVFLWSSPTWRATFRRSLAELRRSSKSSSERAVHAVVSLERLLMAHPGSMPNVSSPGEHRAFLNGTGSSVLDPQQTFLRLVPVSSSHREHVREAHDNGVSLKHAVPRRNPELSTGCNPAID